MKKSILPALLFACLSASAQDKLPDVEVMTGDYKPEWGSLSQWECPEWFQDAKFGIWAHWGVQCHAEAGDWYARYMYYDGHWQNNWHDTYFGDPSVFGLKDLCNDWKGENWDPEYLINRYKSVGARYFMGMGNHHDNFDNWNSTYQEWNTVNIGPKKDIMRGWFDACKKAGLYTGVSFHASHAWTWLEPSTWYDGNLTKEDGYELNPDGTEKWWKGYDPQELYAQNHPHSSGWENDGTIHTQWQWQNGASLPSEEYKQKFQNRVLQFINEYDPNMIYFDDTAMPFYGCDDRIGQNILAHYNNYSAAKNNGKSDVLITGKGLDADQKGYMLWDVERGIPDRAQTKPWQTCTCIGTWHYQQNYGYKDARTVISMLVDIVSKNGNLLLSVPVRSDGTIDDRSEVILDGIKAWMDINSRSIYGTRPWKTFGEGPTAEASNPMGELGFNEGQAQSAEDVRFVQKGDTIYATIMAWPGSQFTFKSFSMTSPYYSGKIKSVELLGYGNVEFAQGIAGLTVEIPSTRPNEISPVFAIVAEDQGATAYGKLQDAIASIEGYVEGVKASNTSYINTGKLNPTYLFIVNDALTEAKAIAETATEDEVNLAIEKLLNSYNEFNNKAFNPGGVFVGSYQEDVTEEFLIEASNFTRAEGTGRFGKPYYWTVENMRIPNGGEGVKLGLDAYEGYESLFLGVWNDAGSNEEGDLSNARLYRKVTLPAGNYYFGAAYNACYQIGTGYMFVSTELCNTGDIPEKSIAYYSLTTIPNNKTIYGLKFEIESEQEVYIGFQIDLTAGSSTQEIRAERVALYRLEKSDDNSLEDLLLTMDEGLETIKDQISNNTGFYNATLWNELRATCDELMESMGELTPEEEQAAYQKLNARWTEFLAAGYNEGGAPANVPSDDITVEILKEAKNFERTEETLSSGRFGAPKNWIVENFGFGTQAGIDNDPGHDCLALEVWGNNASYSANGYDIENIRLYQQVTLPAGRYYFGASYGKFEPNDDLYILATKEIITTAEIPTKSLAYDKVINAPKDGTFRGITFELTEETTLFLGFQADFSKVTHNNLRASEVKLLRYNETTFAVLTENIAKVEAALANVKISDNTGFYSQESYNTILAVMEDIKKVDASADAETIVAAYNRLLTAYEKFLETGRKKGARYDDTNATDITAEYLVEASMFSRAYESTERYCEPLYWTVENYEVVTSQGTRNGLDSYPGMDNLNLGVWDDRQYSTNVDALVDARIYRKVTLEAGSYYFGAIYNTIYNMGDDAYVFVADEVLPTAEIPTKSIAYMKMHDGASDKEFWGVYFTLEEKQEVVLGWQADLLNGYNQKEFRASKVKLAQYGVDGVEEVIFDTVETANAPVEFYTLQGVRLNGAPTKGFYIVKQGAKALKFYKR